MSVARVTLAAALLSTSWLAYAADAGERPVVPRGGNPPAPFAVAASGCQKDTDCKGERICERHECVFPRPKASRAPAAVRAEQAPSPAPAEPPPPSAAPRHVTPEDCAPLGTAALLTGTEIHAGPDARTVTVATVDHLTPACVGRQRQGTGFRRVRLTDGTDGFAEDTGIADLTRSAAPRADATPARAAVAAAMPESMSAEDCAPLVPGFVGEGATVHAGPDTQTRVVAWVNAVTPVCAATDAQGFGMRRVRLPDATEGFVRQSDLSE